MNSRAVGSAPPPFYWKVPVPEKDYMSENYRRIRQIANQTQNKRSQPMKAAFIPGVTKNEKYAHVTSRVGEFLKTKKAPERNDGPVSASISRPQLQRSAPGGNQPINRRLSKSSTDLRPNNSSQPNMGIRNPVAQNQQQPTMQNRRRRGSQESFHSQQESVYNWRFKDDSNEFAPSARFSKDINNSSIPAKYCHRVEYLPCDGICAEENFVVDDGAPESARSASSCRTSRGCNTEETRILEDPVKCFELDKQSVDNSRDLVQNLSIGEPVSKPRLGPKSRSVHTIPSQETYNYGRKNVDSQWFKGNSANEGSNTLDIMSGGRDKPGMGKLKTSASASSLKSGKQAQINGIGLNGAGDFPHNLGSVPKYLTKRQEEWRVQEKEKKELEMNANVPQGYVLLQENERIEHLKTFKRNYDSLINDLNRIPIRIDTIRVREHKIQLEQQLTRLEEAMKTFSRPRVWIKVDD